ARRRARSRRDRRRARPRLTVTASDDEIVPADPPADVATDVPAGAGSEAPHRSWREIPILLVVALAIAIIIKTFLVQAFSIPSISMAPTLERGDRILVCRICTRV